MIRRWIIIVVCVQAVAIFATACTRPPYALGCVKSVIPDGVAITRAIADTADLPAAVDMRSEFSAARDQGKLSSCVAFAVTGALDRDAGAQLSPAMIYALRSTTNCKRDAGMSLYNGLQIAKTSGACLETLFTYPQALCATPADDALADAANHKIVNYAVVWSEQGTANLATIKGLLADGTPVLVAVPVYGPFFSSDIVPSHAAGETYYGGHAMLLVGYDDAGGYFIARNSWGDGWGHDGYAYLSYEFVQQDSWEGWTAGALLSAQPTTLFVSVVDEAGNKFDVAGGKLTLCRDNVEVITKEVVGGAQQFDTRIAATQYCVKPLPPTGYMSKTQGECMTTSAYLTFVWTLAPTATKTAKPTATPTWTKTPTVTPTYTAVYPTDTPGPTLPCPPTEENVPTVPCCTPSPTKCASAFQQFSWAERMTVINTGYTYIGATLEEDIDMTEGLLAIGNAYGFGAPLTKEYTVTGDGGRKLACRGFAYAIVCQADNDPCGAEAKFGVIDWGGPQMALVGGAWEIDP